MMATRFDGMMERGFNTLINGMDQLYNDMKPKIQRFENEIRHEFHRLEEFFEGMQWPTAPTPFLRLHYQLPASPKQTLVKVGNTFLKVEGSFPTFQRFLQQLFEYEVQQSHEVSPALIAPHKRLAGALINTMHVVDEASALMQLIKDFSNEIQHFRNELSLREQTVEVSRQQALLIAMLEKLQTVSLPCQLCPETMEEFSQETRKSIAEMRAEFNSMQTTSIAPVRKDVETTAIQAKEILSASCETQQLYESVREILSRLKSHLLRLGQYKEQLFKHNLMDFSDVEELRRYIQDAQQQQEFVKQMELEALMLMEQSPAFNDLRSSTIESYQKEVNQLVTTHENHLASLNDTKQLTPPKPQPLPAEEKPPEVPASTIPSVSTTSEVTIFPQNRESLIAQQIEGFKSAIQSLLVKHEDAAFLPRLAQDLVYVRESRWNELNAVGQKCATEQEMAQWRSTLSIFEKSDEEVYNQLIKILQKTLPDGYIAQAKHFIAECGTLTTDFFNQFSTELSSDCLKSRELFASLATGSELTFEQLKDLLYTTHVTISHELSNQPAHEAALTQWNTIYLLLLAKLEAAQTFLLADTHNNEAYFEFLSSEQKKFQQDKNAFIVQKFEDMIKEMQSIPPFNFSKDPLHTLDSYVDNWNQHLVLIEKDRQLLSDLYPSA